MPSLESIPAGTWALYALLAAIAVYIYGRAVQHLARQGGKVRTESLDLPELLMSFVLAGTFLLLMLSAIQRQSRGEGAVKIENVLPSSFVFIILCLGILGFMVFVRKLRPGHVFGFDQMSPLAAIGWAVGLCLAALPIIFVAGFVTTLALKDKFAPQPLVELFAQVARQKDYAAIAKIVIVGAIAAPVCEEFLFRGFCYGVWKRYIGPIGAGLLASVLFAALHTSLAAFPSLFILAVCLNIAYERTGSLLVPIGLHATFNFLNLAVLFVQAQMHAAPAPVSP